MTAFLKSFGYFFIIKTSSYFNYYTNSLVELVHNFSIGTKVRGVNGSPEIYPLGGWYMFSSHFAPFKEKHDVVDYETSDGNPIGSYTFSGSSRRSFLIGKHPKGLPKNYQVKDPNTRIHYCGIKHTVIVVSSNHNKTNNANLYSSIYHDYYIADQDRKAIMTDVDNDTRYADPDVLSDISVDGKHVISEELNTKNDLLKNDQSALNNANQQVSLTNSAANDASSLYSDAKSVASAKGTDIYNKSYNAYYDASATSHDANTVLIKVTLALQLNSVMMLR